MWRAVRDDHGTGHFGHDKTINSIQMQLYFPGLKDKVSAYVTSCKYCQRVKSGSKLKKRMQKSHTHGHSKWSLA